jgi:hypothetical protein
MEQEKHLSSLGGFEPPTFRLTAERANQLRHRDLDSSFSALSPPQAQSSSYNQHTGRIKRLVSLP